MGRGIPLLYGRSGGLPQEICKIYPSNVAFWSNPGKNDSFAPDSRFFAPKWGFGAQNDGAFLPSIWGTLPPIGAAMALLADPLDQPMPFNEFLLKKIKIEKFTQSPAYENCGGPMVQHYWHIISQIMF